jgi:hypothetical protein
METRVETGIIFFGEVNQIPILCAELEPEVLV